MVSNTDNVLDWVSDNRNTAISTSEAGSYSPEHLYAIDNTFLGLEA